MAEGVPKYITVRENLRQRIISMDPGEKLPAEPELCKQYNVSRITLRHAIEMISSCVSRVRARSVREPTPILSVR